MLACFFFAVAAQCCWCMFESRDFSTIAGACEAGGSNDGGEGAKLTFRDAAGGLDLLCAVEEEGLAIFAMFILFSLEGLFASPVVVATVREFSTVKVIDVPNGRSIVLNFRRHHLIILYCALALRPRAWA